ncbi:MAG: thiamine-phosphate kinase [Phycisphaerae bacterium]
MREDDFLEWIRSRGVSQPKRVPVGPGDDCAVVGLGGERLVLTTDQLLCGVHFTEDIEPRLVGRKAMNRGLSDVAAMAAVPVCAVATLAAPPDFPRESAEGVYTGLREAGDAFDCPLVGGDVAGWKGPLALSVTVAAAPGSTGWVLRSGAKVGDAVCVTGSFGGAWKGRRHLEFTPRIAEAKALAENYRLHSMIDVSDALSLDLWRICRSSGVGAELFASAVPVSDEVPAGDDAERLSAALGDGEDYELLFTLCEADANRLIEDNPLDVPVARVGRIIAEQNLALVDPDGGRRPATPTGWEHEL